MPKEVRIIDEWNVDASSDILSESFKSLSLAFQFDQNKYYCLNLNFTSLGFIFKNEPAFQ